MAEVLEIASNSRDDRTTFPRYRMIQRFLSRGRFIACVQAADFLMFFSISLWWFTPVLHQTSQVPRLAHLAVAVLLAATMHCVYQRFQLYDLTVLMRGRDAAGYACCAGLISLGPFLAPLLIEQDTSESSNSIACGLVAAALAGTALMRLPLARLAIALQHSGAVKRRIYIIVDSPEAGGLLKADLERWPDNHVIGTWNISAHEGPVKAALEGALTFLRITPVDTIVLKLPLSQPHRFIEAARVLRSLPHAILLAPTLDSGDGIVLYPDRRSSIRHDVLCGMIMVKISDRPLSGWRWLLKDVQDRTLALLLLAVVAPIMMAITIAIKISDPGPVFFRQKRFGYGGDTFNIIKFRTMRVSPSPPDGRTLELTTRHDPRVSPIGRILRKMSLDELPQLINVLCGDMWIVGPRPHSPFAKAGGMIYAEAIQDYSARYRIKPGITGWAQVCGWRGPTDTLEQLRKRVEHDLYYIENWSMSFDIRILFKTISCAFGQENAF